MISTEASGENATPETDSKGNSTIHDGSSYSSSSEGNENASGGDTELSYSLPIYAIVGIAAGSAAVLAVGGFSLFWFVIKKKSFADLLAVFKKKQ